MYFLSTLHLSLVIIILKCILVLKEVIIMIGNNQIGNTKYFSLQSKMAVSSVSANRLSNHSELREKD